MARGLQQSPHGLGGHGPPGAPCGEAGHRGQELSGGQLRQAFQTFFTTYGIVQMRRPGNPMERITKSLNERTDQAG